MRAQLRAGCSVSFESAAKHRSSIPEQPVGQLRHERYGRVRGR